jgi:hypothetical protein
MHVHSICHRDSHPEMQYHCLIQRQNVEGIPGSCSNVSAVYNLLHYRLRDQTLCEHSCIDFIAMAGKVRPGESPYNYMFPYL